MSRKKLLAISYLLFEINWIFLIGKLQLKIKRTARTKSHCCFPNCKEFKQLKTISKANRHFITTHEKVYIPPCAVACAAHDSIDVWRNCSLLIDEPQHNFTKELMEDMFQILTSPQQLSLQANISSSRFLL